MIAWGWILLWIYRNREVRPKSFYDCLAGQHQPWVSSSQPRRHMDLRDRTESEVQDTFTWTPPSAFPLPVAGSDPQGPTDILVIWGKGEGETRRKEKNPSQEQLLHVLVDKCHRLIPNPHQRHGSQHRSHRSLLVSDLLLLLDPPAMAYVPIPQMTVRQ